MGCGDQEMFRNCADVQINSVVGSYPPGALSPSLPRGLVYTGSGDNISPLVVTARVCTATEPYTSVEGGYPGTLSDERGSKLELRSIMSSPIFISPGMDEWCHRSCLSYPPHCPADKCQCLSHCDAVGRLANQEGTDVFCHRKCLRFPPDCPEDLCKCYPAPPSGVDQA